MKEVMKKVYVASDKKEFTDNAECEHHEIKANVQKLVDDLGICRGGKWSADMVAEAIFDAREAFAAIFTKIQPRRNAKPKPAPVDNDPGMS